MFLVLAQIFPGSVVVVVVVLVVIITRTYSHIKIIVSLHITLIING